MSKHGHLKVLLKGIQKPSIDEKVQPACAGWKIYKFFAKWGKSFLRTSRDDSMKNAWVRLSMFYVHPTKLVKIPMLQGDGWTSPSFHFASLRVQWRVDNPMFNLKKHHQGEFSCCKAMTSWPFLSVLVGMWLETLPGNWEHPAWLWNELPLRMACLCLGYLGQTWNIIKHPILIRYQSMFRSCMAECPV